MCSESCSSRRSIAMSPQAFTLSGMEPVGERQRTCSDTTCRHDVAEDPDEPTAGH